MSTQASLTNQRLDAARRFLIMPNDAEPWMASAFENAALFHIQSALFSFIQELKSEYALSCTPELAALLLAAEKQNVSSPVLNELLELSRQDTSWLNELKRSFNSLLTSEQIPSVIKNDNIISSSKAMDDVSLYYLNSLTKLILRFREESLEY